MLSLPLFDDALGRVTESLLAAVPRLVGGLLFLVVAYVAIRLLKAGLRRALARAYPAEQSLVADLAVLVVSIFLWFGTVLTVLGIVGLEELAASLGTAVGFIALGVSYALSEMIEDAVAGIYLLRDPDFNAGDTVVTGSTTGVVTSIGLRKSRLRLEDGDTVVLANGDVESKWTKRADGKPDRGEGGE